MTFSHYSGGARAQVQCVGNTPTNCGNGTSVAVGSAAGIVPYQAVLYRDQLLNNDWWTYNGYIQDATAAAGCASTAASATTGSSRSTSAAACRRT